MLSAAIDDATTGLIDARLGSELIKQRLARKGQGKRGGQAGAAGGPPVAAPAGDGQ